MEEETLTEPKNETRKCKKEINSSEIFELILKFLQILITQTLAKRIISMALIAASVPDVRVSELTGLSDRSVRSLRKALENGGTNSLFEVGGGGKQSRLVGVEPTIIDEINTGNYSSRQQIADMVYEKHGIKMSLTSVSKLLKKTVSNG